MTEEHTQEESENTESSVALASQNAKPRLISTRSAVALGLAALGLALIRFSAVGYLLLLVGFSVFMRGAAALDAGGQRRSQNGRGAATVGRNRTMQGLIMMLLAGIVLIFAPEGGLLPEGEFGAGKLRPRGEGSAKTSKASQEANAAVAEGDDTALTTTVARVLAGEHQEGDRIRLEVLFVSAQNSERARRVFWQGAASAESGLGYVGIGAAPDSAYAADVVELSRSRELKLRLAADNPEALRAVERRFDQIPWDLRQSVLVQARSELLVAPAWEEFPRWIVGTLRRTSLPVKAQFGSSANWVVDVHLFLPAAAGR